MSEENKNDLVQIRTGSIATITAALSELSDPELSFLRVLELEDDKPRKGVTDAIEAVANSRADQAAKDFAKTITAAVTAATTETEAQLKELKQALAVSEQDKAKLVKQLAAAKKKPGAKNAAKPVKIKPQVLQIVARAQLGRLIVFSNSDNIMDPEIPALLFDDSDFIRSRGGDVLARDIEFDGEGPASEIAAAWLVDGKGRASGVSRFAVPLTVGGGRKALLGKRSLKFIDDRPAEEAEAEEEADEDKSAAV
jgi:hypothetical protein